MTIRKIKQRLLRHTGLTDVMWRYRSAGLYCFNFHRIGDWRKSEFDPCVFSCDEQNLRLYLDFFKRNFRVISIADLNDIIQSKQEITEPIALITFDDGYADNYHIAYPLLKELSLPATFFITTNLLDSDTLPWWDEIAWHVRHLPGQELSLQGWSQPVLLSEPVNKQEIRQVLQLVKSNQISIEEQLEELREASKKTLPQKASEALFMDWQQVKELADNGMDIGAHSHSHRILSRLSEQELSYELSRPLELINNHITTPVSVLSYPVGNSSTYNKHMFDEIEHCGYQAAFSFRSYINRELKVNQYQLGRFSIDQPFDELNIKSVLLSADKI